MNIEAPRNKLDLSSAVAVGDIRVLLMVLVHMTGDLRWLRADAPPFLGGLVGFVGYELGATLERLPSIAPVDQDAINAAPYKLICEKRATDTASNHHCVASQVLFQRRIHVHQAVPYSPKR